MKQLDILGKLFGSTIRVKLLKFFLLNQDAGFSVEDIAARLRLNPRLIKNELIELKKAGFIKPKVVIRVIKKKSKGKTKKVTEIKKKSNGYVAAKDFSLRTPLRDLLIESGGMNTTDFGVRFGHVGKIGLLVVSGIFLHDADRSMDMMIVGDRLDRKAIDTEVKKIESEIGKELRYAVFDTSEFMYRLKMYDKLIRDIFDYPHSKIINKIDHPELNNSFQSK